MCRSAPAPPCELTASSCIRGARGAMSLLGPKLVVGADRHGSDVLASVSLRKGAGGQNTLGLEGSERTPDRTPSFVHKEMMMTVSTSTHQGVLVGFTLPVLQEVGPLFVPILQKRKLGH